MSEPDLVPLSHRGTELLDDATTDRHPHQRPIETLEQAVAAGEPEAARLLARGYRERGQLVEAYELLAPLVADGHIVLAGVLADVLADLGLTDDAEHAYRLATTGDDGEAMNKFALFLSDQGRPVEAVVMFERAIAAGDMAAPANLARTYLHDLHDIAAARTVAERHLGACAPTTYCALAEVYAALGRLNEAEQLLRTAVELDAAQAHIDYARFLLHRRDDVSAAKREYRLAGQVHDDFAGLSPGRVPAGARRGRGCRPDSRTRRPLGGPGRAALLDSEFELVTDPS